MIQKTLTIKNKNLKILNINYNNQIAFLKSDILSFLGYSDVTKSAKKLGLSREDYVIFTKGDEWFNNIREHQKTKYASEISFIYLTGIKKLLKRRNNFLTEENKDFQKHFFSNQETKVNKEEKLKNVFDNFFSNKTIKIDNEKKFDIDSEIDSIIYALQKLKTKIKARQAD